MVFSEAAGQNLRPIFENPVSKGAFQNPVRKNPSQRQLCLRFATGKSYEKPYCPSGKNLGKDNLAWVLRLAKIPLGETLVKDNFFQNPARKTLVKDNYFRENHSQRRL